MTIVIPVAVNMNLNAEQVSTISIDSLRGDPYGYASTKLLDGVPCTERGDKKPDLQDARQKQRSLV